MYVSTHDLTRLLCHRLAVYLRNESKTHQHGGFQDRDKPGAQLVGFERATTRNTIKTGINT